MELNMNEFGIHSYKPKDKAVLRIKTVSGNKKGFTKRQVNGAEREKSFYSKIRHTSVKDFRWIFKSNKITDCPVMVQYIDIEHEILGKDIAALKGKTTNKKQIHVSGELVKVPRDLIKLNKDVFMTADILFVNGIQCLFFSVERLSSQRRII